MGPHRSRNRWAGVAPSLTAQAVDLTRREELVVVSGATVGNESMVAEQSFSRTAI